MNLRRAAIFVKVMEEGGFTAAARALGVPKSTVSQAVAQLEKELGVRLLNRSSRAVSATEAGVALNRRAAPALRLLEEASAEAVDAAGPLRGSIRLTAPVEVGTRLLEPVLSRFLLENPGVKLDVILTTRVLDLVEEGIDLAVRGGPPQGEWLVARKLGTQDAGLFAAPAYLTTRGRPRALADLAAHDCIVYRPVGGRATWTLTGPRGEESVGVSARLGVDQFAYVLRAALSGVGVALLPAFLAQPDLTRGALVRLLPRYAQRDRPLQVVYPSARYLSRAVAALRDLLVAALRADGTSKHA